jgi:hypothetical protein
MNIFCLDVSGYIHVSLGRMMGQLAMNRYVNQYVCIKYSLVTYPVPDALTSDS